MNLKSQRFFIITAILLACFGTMGQVKSGVAQQLICSDSSGRVKAEATATMENIFINLEIEPEWHIYAPGSKAGVPFEITIRDECGFEVSGEIVADQNEKGEVGGVATIRIPILKKQGAGNKLDLIFDYQACDALECEEPVRLQFSGDVTMTSPKEVLLVVDADDDRAKRISELIVNSGMNCKVHPYKEKLTKDFCDNYDIVIADCPGFRNSKDGFAAVKSFPRTSTPIIAVGFLGTELIENHKLALTSGYI